MIASAAAFTISIYPRFSSEKTSSIACERTSSNAFAALRQSENCALYSSWKLFAFSDPIVGLSACDSPRSNVASSVVGSNVSFLASAVENESLSE